MVVNKSKAASLNGFVCRLVEQVLLDHGRGFDVQNKGSCCFRFILDLNTRDMRFEAHHTTGPSRDRES